VNQLIIARAQAELGQFDAARTALAEAKNNWPIDMQSPGHFRVTADDGVLWFDSADEWLNLSRSAESRLTMTP
jgi:hypothetical protein